MNNLQKIASLVSKISNLLDAVKKNEGRFTLIEKDLMAGYTRELYELAITIEPDVVDGSTTRLEKQLLHGISLADQSNKELKLAGEDDGAKDKRLDAITLNEKFRNPAPDLAEKWRRAPIKDLTSFIGLNRRFAFINALFNGEEIRYEAEIRKLNSFGNYNEALNYAESHLILEYKWKENEPLIGELLSLVYRRYLK